MYEYLYLADSDGDEGAALAEALTSPLVVGGPPPVTLVSIAVTPANATHTLTASPTPIQYTAMGTFSDASVVDITTSVTWAVVNGAIGTISNGAGTEGEFTPAAVGTTQITATQGAIVGQTDVTVQIVLQSIDVTPNALTWRPTASSDRQQMTATGTFSDGSTQNLTASVTWTSGTPAVGTISNGAGTEGEVTPLTVGPTLITAQSGAVSGNETLTIGVNVDATSGKGVPVNEFQYGMAGLAIASEWQAQEASGDLIGTGPAAFNLISQGTPLFQQAVPGWTRTASAYNQTPAQRHAVNAGAGPNPASVSVLWFGYMVMDTLPGAVRGFMNIGGNCGAGLVNGSGNLRLFMAGVTTDDSTTLPPTDNLVHPFIMLHDLTNNRVILYTDEAKTVGTYAAATDGIKGFGAGIFSVSIPALGGVLLGAVASGASAELSDASVKTFLQNLGWTIPWT